jgi:hypothetical protein
MIRQQFTLYVENRPGALAHVTRKLAEAQISIEGISVSASTDVGLIQLVVDDAGRTRETLVEAGIPFTVQDIALLRLKHEPGALSRVVSVLAREGVNINYVYATANTGGRDVDSYAVISAPDLQRVEETWKSAE